MGDYFLVFYQAQSIETNKNSEECNSGKQKKNERNQFEMNGLEIESNEKLMFELQNFPSQKTDMLESFESINFLRFFFLSVCYSYFNSKSFSSLPFNVSMPRQFQLKMDNIVQLNWWSMRSNQ